MLPCECLYVKPRVPIYGLSYRDILLYEGRTFWVKHWALCVWKCCRISVIFRVRSAKAVKITDMDLIKRLGVIVGFFVLFLLIRTLVAPPKVMVGKYILSSRLCLLRLVIPLLRVWTLFVKLICSSLCKQWRYVFHSNANARNFLFGHFQDEEAKPF